MAALGELFVYLIYLFLGGGCLIFLWKTIVKPKAQKEGPLFWCLLFGLFFVFFSTCKYINHNESQKGHVGKYYLTNYPNCDSCYIELKEDGTYVVVNKGKIVESSDWHYEAGGDYFVVFLNHDKSELGFGNYTYEKYELKY